MSSNASIFDSLETSDTLTMGVKFEYQLEDRGYSGEQEWDISCEGCKKTKEGYKRKYSPGSPVTVYYDPSNPIEAVIEPEADWPSWWLLLAILSGLVALLAATGVLKLMDGSLP